MTGVALLSLEGNIKYKDGAVISTVNKQQTTLAPTVKQPQKKKTIHSLLIPARTSIPSPELKPSSSVF